MKSKLKYALVCSIAVFLAGCGTTNTVIRGDWVAKRNLNQIETSCETIPRIYSGVSYDICLLRGKPSQMALWVAPIPQLIFLDIALSGAFDTVILPYTVYTQISNGDIRLK
ncbi:YceK/YidQ family lipoprotein [Nitrosomonas sp. Nm33]|uniref:YceK/YidQ family lipoprotein n=1 Tax=Nitrosomonas sp. Nm33 TaxID=133724 RepID=UPI000898D566|nr:YceK/YidQ family lipoprotein [Nitrosomonas sp. Nm33]SDY12262.1 Protein of unknown function [Nitrosomonas sp. Nm33]